MNPDCTLQNFFLKICNNSPYEPHEWNEFQQNIFKHGLGLEETLQYIHFNQPSYAQFMRWVSDRSPTIAYTCEHSTEDVLTAEDLAFWDKNGYIVLKQVVSKYDCEKTIKAILQFLNASLEEPASWYEQHERKEGLMLLFTQHAMLEKNRNSAKIKKAFEQLYRTTEIYKTIDKVSFNPPENENFLFMGSDLHWDTSLELPIPYYLQGLLYLNDVDENAGAFHCVPGFHNIIDSWLNALPPNADPRAVALQTLTAVPIAGNAGDFIIWHQALPHCATANRSNSPRFVQYLTYLPNTLLEKPAV